MLHQSNKYPYFIYPDVVSLREGNYANDDEASLLRRRIAANVGDVRALRIILGVDPDEFACFYPDMEKAGLSTTDTIDSFLTRFGKKDAPVPQAAAQIPLATLTDGDVDKLSPGDCLDDDSTTSGRPPSFADAQIMIKNHNYQAALEIIMQLSLINPKKSIYFADQIRFLRKLILNESKQNN